MPQVGSDRRRFSAMGAGVLGHSATVGQGGDADGVLARHKSAIAWL
jgi:hypothetical protein